VPAPGYLSDEEAATLPCAALTAWSALVTMGKVKAGDRVVVQGTGGVSLFALQFAKMHGASVLVTSSQDEKLAKARKLGADEGINYKSTPDWGKSARRWARGLGVDHVVEVGGSGTLDQSIKAVAPGGTISLIGVLAPVTGPVDLVPVLMQNIRIQGVLVGHKESFEAMVAALDAAQCHPIVDRVFPFEEARNAFDYLASGQHFGKVCIRVR
jgi:NADPH:quinone reductase-like Zn-dependent oxidoreductase